MRVEKWAMVEDSGRGWRRVVPSPRPKKIIEADIIKHLVASDYLVTPPGGGMGYPWCRTNREICKEWRP